MRLNISKSCVKFPFCTHLAESYKYRRNELFGISGVRGQYPQFFIVDENKKTAFLGNWDTIEGINDNSHLPENVLNENPSIMTWKKVFEGK